MSSADPAPFFVQVHVRDIGAASGTINPGDTVLLNDGATVAGTEG